LPQQRCHRMHLHADDRPQTTSTKSNHDNPTSTKPNQPTQSTWALSFLYFAGMNASAIVCHCLAARGSPLATAFASLDVAFTGCSSLCLILASLSGRPKPSAAARSLGARAPYLWLPVCAVALVGNLAFPGVRAGLNECIYMATTAAAALVLLVNEVMQTPRGAAGGLAIRIAAAAAAFMSLGSRIDVPLAAASGGWLSAVHAAFAACDVAFCALGRYLAAKHAAQRSANKRKP